MQNQKSSNLSGGFLGIPRAGEYQLAWLLTGAAIGSALASAASSASVTSSRRTVSDQMLGDFDVEEIAPAPAGEPDIEVAFDLDTDGILEVTAQNIATGKAAPVQRYRAV